MTSLFYNPDKLFQRIRLGKYLFSCFILVLSFQLLSQHATKSASSVLYTKVKAAKKSKGKDHRLIDDLLIHNQKKSTIQSAKYFDLNKKRVKTIIEKKEQFISLSIPYSLENSENIVLELYKVPDWFYKSKQQKTAENQSIHYRGVIKGEENQSMVAVSVFNDLLMGIFSITGKGKYVISQTKENAHLIYNDKYELTNRSWSCDAEGNISSIKRTKSAKKTISKVSVDELDDIIVRVFFVVDYDIYERLNSSVPEVENLVTALFNGVATIYQKSSINLAISDIKVLTEQDLYGDNPLCEFEQNTLEFKGDLAQLLSSQFDVNGDPVLRGKAEVKALCCDHQDGPYGESRISEIYPSISTEIIAHEIGHNLGSQHTNACWWNGNCTAIDGCGNKIEIKSPCIDTCQILDNPITSTIMSICNYVTWDLGEQPADTIKQYILNSCIGIPHAIGDVDENGVTSLIDARQVALYAIDALKPEEDLCNPYINLLCLKYADGNGTVSLLDARLIAQCAIGAINELCP